MAWFAMIRERDALKFEPMAVSDGRFGQDEEV